AAACGWGNATTALPGSTATSISWPNAGARLWNCVRTRLPRPCHFEEPTSALAATNATAFAGAIAAAPSSEPGPLAPALAQPAVTIAAAAATAAAGTIKRDMSLLCRLPPHQTGDQPAEVLP